MNDAGLQPVLVREEQLPQLEAFCRRLVEALGRAGLEPDKSFEALRGSLTGECVKCGFRVSGEECFALSQVADGEGLVGTLQRLHLGDCARPGCESYSYRLRFQRHPDTDWIAILSQVEHIKEEQAGKSAAVRRAASLGVIRRVGLALVIVALLLLFRQWYFGGRIPLIREPEKFRVDPAPPGGEAPR
jgi:hypothetical protein